MIVACDCRGHYAMASSVHERSTRAARGMILLNGGHDAAQAQATALGLRRAGYSVVRQTGSHQIWQHPDVPGFEVYLAGRDSADAHPYQERDVRKGLRRSREVEEENR